MSTRAEELRQRLVRNIDEVALEHDRRDPLYEWRTASLALGTAAVKLGASIDEVPPGKRACPYHLHHAQEELFVVLAGSGHLRVAGEMVPVKAGDVVFIPAGSDYPHQFVNTSDAPLRYLSISTRETPEVCEYPDSGKVMAFSRAGREPLRQISRPADSLDYWDGEP